METYFLLRGVVYQSVACLSPKYTVTTLVRSLYDMAETYVSGFSPFCYLSGEYNGKHCGNFHHLPLSSGSILNHSNFIVTYVTFCRYIY